MSTPVIPRFSEFELHYMHCDVCGSAVKAAEFRGEIDEAQLCRKGKELHGNE